MGATLLIMGAMIGTGMLGMPAAQGNSGLIPGFAMLLFCWLYTLCCSRLLLEACTWFPKGSSFMSIATELLGKKVAVLFWCVYAILFYCGITSHIAAAGDAIGGLFQNYLSNLLSSVFFTLFLGLFAYNSMRATDNLNRLFIFGLSLISFLFILVSYPYVKVAHLIGTQWTQIFPAIHIFLFAFIFQFIIPSLYSYLECDARALKKAIWIGSTCTLLLYAVWLSLILGVVPGKELARDFLTGKTTLDSLEAYINNPFLSGLVHEFVILALSTSFLALSITFFDFWADTLKWTRRGYHGIVLIFLVLVIPLILAMNFPQLFVRIVDLGGFIGATIAFGIFPVLFVWIGRYYKYRQATPALLPGGKFALILIILASIGALILSPT